MRCLCKLWKMDKESDTVDRPAGRAKVALPAPRPPGMGRFPGFAPVSAIVHGGFAVPTGCTPLAPRAVLGRSLRERSTFKDLDAGPYGVDTPSGCGYSHRHVLPHESLV